MARETKHSKYNQKKNGNIPNTAQKCTAKLPKLQIKRFSGNVQKWTAFWQAYKINVHTSKALSAVSNSSCGNTYQNLNKLNMSNASIAGKINILIGCNSY